MEMGVRSIACFRECGKWMNGSKRCSLLGSTLPAAISGGLWSEAVDCVLVNISWNVHVVAGDFRRTFVPTLIAVSPNSAGSLRNRAVRD